MTMCRWDFEWPVGARRARRVSARTVVLLWLAMAAGSLQNGCARRAENPSQDGAEEDPTAVVSRVERGPVRFDVSLRPGAPRLSDEPVLTLTIRAAAGVEIEKPPFGEAVGDFLVRDFHEPLPQKQGEVTVLRQQYTLEPMRAGTLAIDPITIKFIDRRTTGTPSRHQIQSEDLAVEVSTVLGDDAPSLSGLRPAASPVALPPPPSRRLVWGGLAAVALGTLAATAFWWRKRKVDEPELSPAELAWLELERLVAADLAVADIKAYYSELTGVVRRFIERSTGIRAPEQTTEEFLRAIARDQSFSAPSSQRLAAFLQAADLVKFAGYQPASHDIEESFRRAQQFIGLEREVETGAAI
ncbi:MAG: hypothetical protein VX346_15590 [Planctomycetota bacterium]|nr:hypothetical protein [Planctomycetota bacterium]